MNTLKVINIIGQELFNKEVNSNKVQIDLSNFLSGTYFIHVTTGKTIKTVRIIKR